ncbi:hypothetical protein L873DRAFT_1811537 [Choiromyces venosus 120613-1]|uniref:Uncharacterized protein n=1 Tax=Choiromyces venosus 120613-1 TaxID=1336337 RepID=A0A3N4JI44_9PEZI|nr:hypothetical protein L873DRAFT_1811537 [Choiromyces venosus 120613-1]
MSWSAILHKNKSLDFVAKVAGTRAIPVPKKNIHYRITPIVAKKSQPPMICRYSRSGNLRR